MVDNIPYVATMSPIVVGLVEQNGGQGEAQVLWWVPAWVQAWVPAWAPVWAPVWR